MPRRNEGSGLQVLGFGELTPDFMSLPRRMAAGINDPELPAPGDLDIDVLDDGADHLPAGTPWLEQQD